MKRHPRNRIRAILVLPLLAGLLLAATAEWMYRVKPGDTLESICGEFVQHAGCPEELARLNELGETRQPRPGTVLRIPAAWLKEAPIVGGVLQVDGDATYSPGGSEEFFPLVVDEPVYLGDVIRTAEGSALLEFVSGLIIQLRPNSVLLLESFAETDANPMVEIALDHGGMEVIVPEFGVDQPVEGEFQVAAGPATASIDGEARVRTDESGAEVQGAALGGSMSVEIGTEAFRVPQGYGVDASSADPSFVLRELLPVPEFSNGSMESIDVGGLLSLPNADIAVLQSYQRMFVHEPQRAPERVSRRPGNGVAGWFESALHRVPGDPKSSLRWGHVFRPVVLEWEAAAQARQWQLELLATPRPMSIRRSYRLNAPRIEMPDLEEGCYVLAVLAIDEWGMHGMERRLPLCVHAPLAAPVVSRDKDAANSLAWIAVDGAERYTVEMARDPGFSDILRREDSEPARFDLPTVPEPVVYARVRALNEEGMSGPPSNVLRFPQPQQRPR